MLRIWQTKRIANRITSLTTVYNKKHLNTMTELSIPLPCGSHIAGKIWNPKGDVPILALHGWLDNCGTFDTLAPLFPSKYCIVAIDFPGHGFSSRRPIGCPGSSLLLVQHIHRVIHYFKWDKVTLMGHSMGGGAAFMYACTLPDKVDKLILLDSLKPGHVDPDKQPSRSAEYLNLIFDCEEKLLKSAPVYEYQELLDRMLKSYRGSLTEESAKILLKRGSTETNNKYSFNYDIQLKLPNPMSLTHDQLKAFSSCIKCEVLIIKASKGPFFEDKKYYLEILDIIKIHSPKVILKIIEGTHHLHLNNPEFVMPFIEKFLMDDIIEGDSTSKL